MNPMQHIQNYINGKQVPPESGEYLDNFEPATGLVYSRVPASGAKDINAAVAAAKSAFPAWSSTAVATRSDILNKLADLIDQNVDQFARAESIDTGKPLSLARMMDIPRSASNFRFFATAMLHSATEMHEFDGGGSPGGVPSLNYTLRKPRGVAGLISPWNLPLYLATWKLGPALATGNTAVLKPSEVTPMTASLLGDLCNKAGIPAGVLNIVHGTGPDCGGHLVQHADVPTVSFTGSTKVGQWIGQTGSASFKRVSLELGGKNAFVIFEDADLPTALAAAVRAGFTNQGQICLCGSRILVHQSLFKEAVAAITQGAKNLRVGDPLEPETQQGALTSKPHFDKVAGMVKMARDLGGTIHCGGGPVAAAALPQRCKQGYFFEPTVITGLDPACTIEQEEIFGPVVTIQSFKDEEHAIALANGTKYGLAAAVFTQNLARAHRVAAKIDAGVVWVNCWLVRDLRTPFGGAKASGVGREGGVDAIKFFTEPKNICIGM